MLLRSQPVVSKQVLLRGVVGDPSALNIDRNTPNNWLGPPDYNSGLFFEWIDFDERLLHIFSDVFEPLCSVLVVGPPAIIGVISSHRSTLEEAPESIEVVVLVILLFLSPVHVKTITLLIARL